MGVKIESGCYKMKFDTKSYFTTNGVKGFYPYVEVSKLLNIPCHKYMVFVSGMYVLVCDVY